MVLLAWRQMMVRPGRALLTVLTVGSVLALILILQGFEQGQYRQLARAVLDRRADLIVAQRGVATLLARSSIPQLARQQVEGVAGVRSAQPMTVVPAIYEHAGRRTPLNMFVIDEGGGPPVLSGGRSAIRDREIIIDESLASMFDIGLGDDFVVSDFTFLVSGIARRSAAFFTPFVFISYDGMIDLFLESELAPDISAFPLLSFLLVRVDPGADRLAVARDIESQLPSVDALPAERMAGETVALGRSFLAPIMGVLVRIAFAIAVVVIALIMHMEVSARLTTFAVLKALGFSSGGVWQAVLWQALLVMLIALPVGLILAQAFASAVSAGVPLYEVRPFEARPLAGALTGTVVAAIVGSTMPLWSIRRVDPASAFTEV